MKLKNILQMIILGTLSIGYIAEANANFTGRVYTQRACHQGNSTHGMRTYCNDNRYLEITSEFDDPITITDVKVNRGNCRILYIPSSKTRLLWGQSEKWTIRDHCNVREVTIETDRGSQTLQWK